MPRRTSSQRRWTIADMDDDEFLRQLETKLSGSGSRLRKSRVLEEFAMGADQGYEDPEAEAEADLASESDDSAADREWDKARRAMMCVREIVRTEKSYLRHMVGFLGGDVSRSFRLMFVRTNYFSAIGRVFDLARAPSASDRDVPHVYLATRGGSLCVGRESRFPRTRGASRGRAR